ncbi:hypothetical protein DIPPA_13192 [Diplonema papillatum]|nr:hypothetical protein DIPPA_13192 [Diplonema papillatum]
MASASEHAVLSGSMGPVKRQPTPGRRFGGNRGLAGSGKQQLVGLGESAASLASSSASNRAPVFFSPQQLQQQPPRAAPAASPTPLGIGQRMVSKSPSSIGGASRQSDPAGPVAEDFTGRLHAISHIRKQIDELQGAHKKEELALLSTMKDMLQRTQDEKWMLDDIELRLQRETEEKAQAVTLYKQFKDQGGDIIQRLSNTLTDLQQKYSEDGKRCVDLQKQVIHLQEEVRNLNSEKATLQHQLAEFQMTETRSLSNTFQSTCVNDDFERLYHAEKLLRESVERTLEAVSLPEEHQQVRTLKALVREKDASIVLLENELAETRRAPDGTPAPVPAPEAKQWQQRCRAIEQQYSSKLAEYQTVLGDQEKVSSRLEDDNRKLRDQIAGLEADLAADAPPPAPADAALRISAALVAQSEGVPTPDDGLARDFVQNAVIQKLLEQLREEKRSRLETEEQSNRMMHEAHKTVTTLEQRLKQAGNPDSTPRMSKFRALGNTGGGWQQGRGSMGDASVSSFSSAANAEKTGAPLFPTSPSRSLAAAALKESADDSAASLPATPVDSKPDLSLAQTLDKWARLRPREAVSSSRSPPESDAPASSAFTVQRPVNFAESAVPEAEAIRHQNLPTWDPPYVMAPGGAADSKQGQVRPAVAASAAFRPQLQPRRLPSKEPSEADLEKPEPADTPPAAADADGGSLRAETPPTEAPAEKEPPAQPRQPFMHRSAAANAFNHGAQGGGAAAAKKPGLKRSPLHQPKTPEPARQRSRSPLAAAKPAASPLAEDRIIAFRKNQQSQQQQQQQRGPAAAREGGGSSGNNNSGSSSSSSSSNNNNNKENIGDPSPQAAVASSEAQRARAERTAEILKRVQRERELKAGAAAGQQQQQRQKAPPPQQQPQPQPSHAFRRASPAAGAGASGTAEFIERMRRETAADAHQQQRRASRESIPNPDGAMGRASMRSKSPSHNEDVSEVSSLASSLAAVPPPEQPEPARETRLSSVVSKAAKSSSNTLIKVHPLRIFVVHLMDTGIFMLSRMFGSRSAC